MSIQSEANRIKSNIADAYSAAAELEATMPEQQNSDNLPDAIRSIPGARDALTYKNVVTLNVGNSFTTFAAALSGFNHAPKSGECFVAVLNMADGDVTRSWLAYCSADEVSGDAVMCNIESYTETTGEAGVNGIDGREYLIYTELVRFYSGEYTGGGRPAPPTISKFNRTPVVGDVFIMIRYDITTSKKYISTCKITSATEYSFGYEIISSTDITGENGEDGNNGLDYLIYNDVIEFSTYTGGSVGAWTPPPEISPFNRTPAVGDTFILITRDTYTNKTYINTCTVDSISGSSFSYSIVDSVDITGAKGEDATLPIGTSGDILAYDGTSWKARAQYPRTLREYYNLDYVENDYGQVIATLNVSTSQYEEIRKAGGVWVRVTFGDYRTWMYFDYVELSVYCQWITFPFLNGGSICGAKISIKFTSSSIVVTANKYNISGDLAYYNFAIVWRK